MKLIYNIIFLLIIAIVFVTIAIFLGRSKDDLQRNYDNKLRIYDSIIKKDSTKINKLYNSIDSLNTIEKTIIINNYENEKIYYISSNLDTVIKFISKTIYNK